VIYMGNSKNPWLLFQTAGILTACLMAVSYLLPFTKLRWIIITGPIEYWLGYETALIYLLPFLLLFIAYGIITKKGEYLIISGTIGIISVWGYMLRPEHDVAIPELRLTCDVGLSLLGVTSFCAGGIGFLMCLTSEKAGLLGGASQEQALLSVMLMNTLVIFIYLVIYHLFNFLSLTVKPVDWIPFFILLIFVMPGILLLALLPIHQAVKQLTLGAAYICALVGIGLPFLVGVFFTRFARYGLPIFSFTHFIEMYCCLPFLVLPWSALVALWMPFIKKFFFPKCSHDRV